MEDEFLPDQFTINMQAPSMTSYLLSWDAPSAQAQLSIQEKRADLFRQLSELIKKERCFLDPTLKMEHICQCLQATPITLLKAVKQNNFRNFPHFINHHRIEAAKSMMAQEAFDIYTLEAIAEKSGFGTRQAFYNTFERLVGMKPACYRRVAKQQRLGFEPDSSAP